MRPSDVTPYLQKGQFWACRKPLSLFRIDNINDDTYTIEVTEWNPNKEGTWQFTTLPNTTNWVLLSVKLAIARASSSKKPQAGDVWLVNGSLYFIGRDSAGNLAAYADGEVPVNQVDFSEGVLFQKGPFVSGGTYWDFLETPES